MLPYNIASTLPPWTWLVSNTTESLFYFVFCLPLQALLLSNIAESLLSGYSRDFQASMLAATTSSLGKFLLSPPWQ